MSLQHLVIISSAMLLLPSIPSIEGSAVLIADFSMTRMIELSARHPFCRLHRDRGDIQRMLLSADQRRIRQVPRESVLALENVCHDTGGLTTEHQGGLGFIYPGTKWCGPGNLAVDYSDLGRYAEEDRCCREHDMCPNTLAPGECRRGLCNTGGFTRSHCDCDARFRRCLRALNTETANTLGAVFFNVVQVTCFRERSPCSVWQRSASKLDPSRLVCPLSFRASDLYVPVDDRFIMRLVNQSSKGLFDKNFISRAFNVESDPNFGEIRNRISVQLASFGLIAKNFLKETVGRPVGELFQFLRGSRKNDWSSKDGAFYY